MSDSELSEAQSGAVPDASTIESTLRRIVRDALKNDEEITMKIARTKAEEELGLDAGFLKSDVTWKDRSKEIVEAAVDEPESPVKPKKNPAAKAGRKRKSAEAEEKPRKRARKSPVVESDEEEEEEEEEEKPKPKPKAQARARKAPAPKSASDSDEEEEEKQEPKPKARRAPARKSAGDSDNEEEETKPEPKAASPGQSEDDEAPAKSEETTKPAEDDDSDLSSLIDDPPPPKKKRGKKSTSPSTTTTKKATAKAKAKPAKTAGKDLTPDEEEIKRLQGWLVKCGIRKLWHKELAPYDTSKSKISHLKAMLSDAGMTGRYSVEKARGIKEARELREELEAVEEFNEQWGKEGEGEGDEGEEEEEKPRETRRLPKGLVDFGDSGDEASD